MLTNSEVGRLALLVLDGNENPTEDQIQKAVEEVGTAMDVMSNMSLPLLMSLGFGCEPQRAQVIGLILLAATLTEELRTKGTTTEGFATLLPRVLQLVKPLLDDVLADVEAERAAAKALVESASKPELS